MHSQIDNLDLPEFRYLWNGQGVNLCSLSSVICLLLSVVWLLPAPVQAKYDGGNGTEGSPYRISTAQQLNDIGATQADWNKHFILVNDIDLGDLNGAAFNIIGVERLQNFSGVFDGNDHEVSGLDIVSARPFYTGLFGCVGGEIKNLGLASPRVSSQGDNVGALVGYLDQGSITSCYAENADVSGADNIGGLVGNNAGRIFKSSSTGDVAGVTFVGGLVGLLSDGTVTTSYSKAEG